MDTPAVSGKVNRTLEAIRNPMIFNAFAILAAIILGGLVAMGRINSASQVVFVGISYLFIIGVTVWLNYFASTNPRFLAYGPAEYIRESELSHEREMAKIRASRSADSSGQAYKHFC